MRSVTRDAGDHAEYETVNYGQTEYHCHHYLRYGKPASRSEEDRQYHEQKDYGREYLRLYKVDPDNGIRSIIARCRHKRDNARSGSGSTAARSPGSGPGSTGRRIHRCTGGSTGLRKRGCGSGRGPEQRGSAGHSRRGGGRPRNVMQTGAQNLFTEPDRYVIMSEL